MNHKLIMENWRGFVSEAAKTSQDFTADMKVYVEEDSDYIGISIGTDDAMTSNGNIEIEPLSGCDNVWYVSGVEAQPGFGPMLYDLAIAFASRVNGYLTADKGSSTTSDAYSVWKYYYNNRRDVRNRPMSEVCPEYSELPRMRGAQFAGGSKRFDQGSEEYNVLNSAYYMTSTGIQQTIRGNHSGRIVRL